MPIKKKRGRPKTPTFLAKKLGHRSSRINEKEMQTESFTIPFAPKGWSENDKKRYYSVTTMLNNNNLLTSVNIDLVMAYCIEMSNYFEAVEEMKKRGNGKMIKNHYGEKMINPWLKIMQASFNNALKIGREFGFTPSTSAGIQVPSDNNKNKNDEFSDV